VASREKKGLILGGTSLNVERVAIADLNADARNPRRMPEHEMAALKRSLAEYGAVEPAVVNRDWTIIGGHQRVQAARELGWAYFPVVWVDLDDDKARLLNLALNRIHGEWDEDLLVEMLANLHEQDADLSLSGFDSGELDALLALVDGVMEPGRDTEPGKPPDQPVTQLGDLVELGKHRLVCGDASDPRVLDAVLAGTPADLVIADPPYGVHYQGGAQEFSARTGRRKVRTVTGDENASLYAATLPLLRDRLREDGALYLWHSDSRAREVLAALADAGFRQRCVLIWAKDVPTGSLLAHYIPRHEPIVYASTCERAPRWFGPTNEVTVWEHPKPRINEHHPTQKPVALFERAMLNSSQLGETVLDPFGGSGTAVIACENVGRAARLVELEAALCDVIVDRWERHTGREATRARVEVHA
jgi:DNA modification methylase